MDIPRSREVKQSFLTAIGTTIWSIVFCLLRVYQYNPKLLLCNGPGTCLPLCVATKALRALGFVNTKICFVESVCRVKSLSLTGNLLYKFHLVDQFQVQWPELHKRYACTLTVMPCNAPLTSKYCLNCTYLINVVMICLLSVRYHNRFKLLADTLALSTSACYCEHVIAVHYKKHTNVCVTTCGSVFKVSLLNDSQLLLSASSQRTSGTHHRRLKSHGNHGGA
jgi:hypothetical protein